MRAIRHLLLLTILLVALLLSFWSIPFPLSWQEKFLTHHYEFYFLPTYQWEQRRNIIEVFWVKLINLKMGYDWRNKTVEKLNKNNHYPFQASVSYIKNHFNTQLELPIYVTQMPTYAGLIKGFGTCDQINGGLGLLLSGFCDKSELLHLKNQQIGSHSLVKTYSKLGVIYADAFNEDGVYGFPDELTKEGEGIPSSTEKDLLFTKNEYKKAELLTPYHLINRISNKFLRNQIQFNSPSPYKVYQSFPQARYDDKKPDVMKLYLLARIAHLNGESNLAKKRYQQLIEVEKDGFLRTCSTLFLKKM